jgi:hypothetical protein
MKRILFLICALLLLADLADEGRLDKVRLAAPQCPGKFSSTYSSQHKGEVALQVNLRLANLPDIAYQFQLQI